MERRPLWEGRDVIRNVFMEYMFFCATLMLTISHNHSNPIIHNLYTKSFNYVLNQNMNVNVNVRFATFALSIVDNLCLLQQYE